ncbi:hypothetical protein [Micromonospora sp. NPDC047074]|uniref:methylation-associated defense system ATP-binding protein MAD8 n=1 Tax=Micromonospora sp. NPDC047074 TaxID=3154339 RepID=UPI0033D69BAD
MSTGLREVTDTDLDEALERVLVPRFAALLAARAPGHCVRVTDLGAPLAAQLCRRLRAATGTAAQIHVLGQPPQVPDDVAISGTKLVELRNPDADDRQRPPLLVFIPPGTHASAEDSFGVATFEQSEPGDIYQELATRLQTALPDGLRTAISELFGVLDEQATEAYGIVAGPLQRARFLLSVEHNDRDPQAAGGALFELGLIPDFELFADPAQVRTRATRNARTIQALNRADRSVRQRVVDLRLTDAAFRTKVAEFLTDAGRDTSLDWTRRIVVDRANWGLSFHRWPLPEDRIASAVRITIDELPLPRAGGRPEHRDHPVLGSITGQAYLPGGTSGHNQLSVVFGVTPDARQVRGLTSFSVQLMSEESGPTGIHTTVKVGTNRRQTYKAMLKRLRPARLDHGWHYIRVTPMDSAGVPLPVETSQHASRRDQPESELPASHPDNESHRFYVVAENDLDEPPSHPNNRRTAGVTQELLRLAFEASADGRDWQEVSCQQTSWKDPARTIVEADFGGHGTAQVPLAPILAELERQILAEPTRLAGRQLSTAAGQSPRLVEVEHQHPPLAASERLDKFLATRAAVLTAISGDDGMVVAGRDLSRIDTAVLAYAEAYTELLNGSLHSTGRIADTELTRQLTTLLQIDTVVVEHQDIRGNLHQLTLVAPTHPLRLLWMVTWARLGRHWLAEASSVAPLVHVVAAGDKDRVRAAAQRLFALAPTGFPLTAVGTDGRLSAAAVDLATHWGVYLPAETGDPQTLLADVASALGVPDSPSAALTVTAGQLADRIERYVRMHPYVATLVLCVVNPGRAEQLADTLIELERRKNLRHLSYDLRLFAADPQQTGTGMALAQLLSGEWSTTAEAETFCTPTSTGLAPKLAVAVLPLDDFRSATSRHTAHLTLLFDAFSGEDLGVGPARPDSTAPVHGLVQELTVDYVDTTDGIVAWHKQPRHGPGRDIPGSEEYSDLLTALPQTISVATATVATGEAGTGLVPRITLNLTAADASLLHQAHRCSDWVITVDRTLGVEYFDSPGSSRRTDYIIDFASTGPDGLGHQLVVSSRSVDELRSLLRPMLDQHGFQVDRRHAGTFFDQLRLLSGRLAFKIASTAPNQRTEVLGLALARLYLSHQAVLGDQILVPLDSHLELYRDARRRADEVAESVGLRRTDLALFSLDAQRRAITCRLVEVKCHSTLTSIADLQKVRNEITEQLSRSRDVLAEGFDPAYYQPDRPDRASRNAELAALLRFYLGRAVRHGIIDGASEIAEEAHWMLDHLDWGYQLSFTQTGLIFDLRGSGTDQDDEGEVEFHRVGRDVISELLGGIATDPVLAAASPTDTHSEGTFGTRQSTVARLPQAAFRAPARDHVVPQGRPPSDRDPETPNNQDDAITDATPIGPEPVESTGPAELLESTDRSEQPLPDPPAPSVQPDIYIGAAGPSPQYGIIGEYGGRHIALDLNETHTISLFGVQGAGKSYTLGTIVEAASLATPPVNRLPQPLATIIFHYSPILSYVPEFTSLVAPNSDATQVQRLRDRYGVAPAGLDDVLMLIPEDQLEQRRTEYPGIELRALKFSSTELRAAHWRFLMGAVGNQSTYIRQLGRIMKAHRNNLSINALRAGVDQSSLSDPIKQLAHQRLDLAADYIDDTARIQDLVRPGRVIIVDLRDELIEKDEALGLFVVLMELFSEATSAGRRFNKLVVFDEAHKFIDSPDLAAGLIESVREMRHKGMSILVASQEPASVPIALIELSNQLILHRFTSPAWLKHLQKANAALADLTPAKMAALGRGEAYIWSGKATDPDFSRRAVKAHIRPRITEHGGSTKTAVAAD